jgi:hypothetical protein
MTPLHPTGSPKLPALKRKASEDLSDLLTDMNLGNGKAPSAVGRDKRARMERSPSSTPSSPEAPKANFPHRAPVPAQGAAGPSRPPKRKASIDESGEAGPSAAIQEKERPKRQRAIPRGQTEKAYAGGDRDFRNPDGSSVHKPMQGPVSIHFGHGTVVVGNGASVKIDHPEGTTVLSREGEAPTVLKPARKAADSLPGGGRMEDLGGGDMRIYLPDRVVTHFGSGLTRTEMHPAFSSQRGFYETDSDGAHRFVEASSPELP